jgi:hypothetical protein
VLFTLIRFPWLSILAGDLREKADKSAVAAINRALRFTRKDVDPLALWRKTALPLAIKNVNDLQIFGVKNSL